MNDWANFWEMGGYAHYVWSAYAITLAVLIACLLIPLWRHRILRRKLRQQHRKVVR